LVLAKVGGVANDVNVLAGRARTALTGKLMLPTLMEALKEILGTPPAGSEKVTGTLGTSTVRLRIVIEMSGKL
jgi:hypothetical protein